MSTGQGFVGNNMFAYCGNNPVINVDYTGMRHCAAVSINEENAYDRFISCNYQRTVSLQELGQIVDITEKLNGFMEENAQKLRDYAYAHNPIDTLIYFVRNVTDGGALDIKLQNEWRFEEGKTYIYKGMVLRYDDPGNINFGYVGAELFPRIVLCIGAGLNQLTKPNVPHSVFSFFDDPRDTYMIKYGYGINKGWY